MNSERILFFDLETTGLGKDAGVVEVGIIDADGETVFHSLVNPFPILEWPKAEELHGLGPQRVKHAPLFHELIPAVFRVINGSTLVIYNAAYDTKYFPTEVLAACAHIRCAMIRFSSLKGELTEWGSYKWWKLFEASKIAGYVSEDGVRHRVIGDCKATRAVWRYCERREGFLGD